MTTLQGRYGQVLGPFSAGADLLAPGGAIDKQTPESTPPVIYKLGIIAPEGTKVQINETLATISHFGVLELDEVVNVRKLIFPNGAGNDVIIDYIY